MTTTTDPVWESPLAPALACATATVASTILIMHYITIPYVMTPTVELWGSYIMTPLETYIISPNEIIETIRELGSASIIAAASAIIGVVLLTVVPLTVIVGVPMTVSYVVWMRIVYKRMEGSDAEVCDE